MTQPDAVFLRSDAWLREAFERALSQLPEAQRAASASALWTLAGRKNPDAPLPEPQALTLEDFTGAGVEARGLAVAALVAAEALNALNTVSQAVAFLTEDKKPDAADAARHLAAAVRQVQAIVQGVNAAARTPATYGLAKLLLTLSGDASRAQAAGESAAQQLARLACTKDASQGDLHDAASALGVFTAFLGGLIDRSFAQALDAASNGWMPQNLPIPLPPDMLPRQELRLHGPNGTATLAFQICPPPTLSAYLEGALQLQAQTDSGPARLALDASTQLQFHQPLLPPGPAQVTGTLPQLRLSLSKPQTDGLALHLGPLNLSDLGSAEIRIGELGATLLVGNPPRLDVFLKQAELHIQPADALLKEVLRGGLRVAFDIEAQLDPKGQLHFKDGSGLTVSLPVPQLPAALVDLGIMDLAIVPKEGLSELALELSTSFKLDLGPFHATVDKLGARISLLDVLSGQPHLDFGIKPAKGLGLKLGSGAITGGGYLSLDPAKGEYAGALDLKFAGVGVKAIGILNTRLPDTGWSLLLLVYGKFTAIQLSFGFTLTGVGGLLGVQHTADTQALSRGVSSGALDHVLFPANPVGDAPRLIQTLRGLFPPQKGGFVIGPMLEVGWGTPSLLSLRAGVLVERTQIVIVGQALIQLPPLVKKEMAILRLQVDFAGYVVFDPFRLGFDGALRDSRMLFITLTGQFALRARFDAKPSFLLSAGGFHPRFADIPDDVPALQRLGAGFSIGIIGVKFEGYFALTAATIQTGASLRIWGKVGIASFEGGFDFDAIAHLKPRFYFEVDMRVWVRAKILGCSLGVTISGSLSGPGRWHTIGHARVDLGFLGSRTIHFDESWGQAIDTPQSIEDFAALLAAEIRNPDNWSVQLPPADDAFVTLATTEGVAGLLAHPRSPLTFRQKQLPLGVALAHMGHTLPKDANHFGVPTLQLSGLAASFPGVAVKDHFASAQFFERSEDDRLSGPSFEPFDSGFGVQVDHFDCGPLVSEDLTYEEVNLSEAAPSSWRTHIGAALAVQADSSWWLSGASVARRARLAHPKTTARADLPLTVIEAGYLTTERRTAQPTSQAATYTHVKSQMQADFQISEAFENLL